MSCTQPLSLMKALANKKSRPLLVERFTRQVLGVIGRTTRLPKRFARIVGQMSPQAKEPL